MSYYKRQIPDSLKNKVKYNCMKCGSFPVIGEGKTDWMGDFDSYIICPNEECNNIVFWQDEKLTQAIKKWNLHNLPLYVPTHKPIQLDSCNNCKMKHSCKYARNYTRSYLKEHYCDDFIKEEKEDENE